MRKRLLILLISAAAKTAAAAAPATQPGGLTALDEQRVMTELANRGMETLLRRDFELNHTPSDQQSGMLAMVSIHTLSDPSAHLTSQQRQELLAKISAGISAALPGIHDPKMLMQMGKVMITSSVDPDINTLEYWGENANTRQRVRPAVETVLQIYQQAVAMATAKADEIAATLSPNDDAAAKRWQVADDLRNLATFNRFMAEYDRCLTLDPTDPQRISTADAAIDGLKPFDTNDSAVQAAVRIRIAKLNMAKGDYEAARQVFSTVINNPNGQIQPAPTVAEQYDAKYFTIVCEILGKSLDEVPQHIDTLETWQKTNLDAGQQNGVAAALVMLRYRYFSTAADAATDPVQNQQFNSQAIAILLQLLHDQPQYRTVIFEQVRNRLPENPDLSSLDPLLLLAIQQEGEQQYIRPAGEKVDTKAMERAIAAAQEIVRRRGQAGVDQATAVRSAYVIPYLLERLGREQEAAAAFLDFAEQFPLENKDANDALDHATAIIGQLRKADPQDQQTRKLYDRFLPLAIGSPYNRRQFAFEDAVLLQREQKYIQAIEMFRQVPADDQRIGLARFYMMVALKQRLDDPQDKMGADERQAVLAQVQTLADQVNTDTTAALAIAATADEKSHDASRLVRTALIAADLAESQQKDPNRTLKLLAGFEDKVKGQPNEHDLLFEAQSLRVNAYMELGQTDQATAALVTMLKNSQGNDGPSLVFDLLKKLDDQLSDAQARQDKVRVRQLAQNRAMLSGFLVSWAENNPDEKIKSLTPKYKVFDAKTKQVAAELTDDPATRKTELDAALKQYQDLFDANNPDPQVQLGMGLVDYDLQDYVSAKQMLGSLLVNKKVGGPLVQIEQNGQPKWVENTGYWEANLKLLRSVMEVEKQKQGDPTAEKDLSGAKIYLKQLYVQWPKTVGGQKFHNDFEVLRAELVPDFQPGEGESATTRGVG